MGTTSYIERRETDIPEHKMLGYLGDFPLWIQMDVKRCQDPFLEEHKEAGTRPHPQGCGKCPTPICRGICRGQHKYMPCEDPAGQDVAGQSELIKDRPIDVDMDDDLEKH